MVAGQATIEAGDYVRLIARELPHHDGAGWWWRVASVNDISLDAVYENGARVLVSRFGVDLRNVVEHRRADR